MCSSAMALPPSSQIAALIRGVASHKQVFINNRDRSGQTKRLSAANNDLTRQRFNRLTVQRSTKLIAQCVSEGTTKVCKGKKFRNILNRLGQLFQRCEGA